MNWTPPSDDIDPPPSAGAGSVAEVEPDTPPLEIPEDLPEEIPVAPESAPAELPMAEALTAVPVAPAPAPAPIPEPHVEPVLAAAAVAVADTPQIHVFVPASDRPIDRFVATVLNEIGKNVGARVNSGRRGQAVTIIGITEDAVLRATDKGTTAPIPRAALEWAIKQLYRNGELARSKMTESYRENGSTVASGVFQLLSSLRYFEATELPMTLHFYRLQWEEELG